MQEGRYLVRVPVSGACTVLPVPESVTEQILAELLETDVTERMRMPAAAQTDERSVLCYFIDARGGEKNLPVNFRGTCFYHTGCPIHGDLLLARCPADAAETGVFGLDAAEAERLCAWVHAQFPDLQSFS